ncbi:S-adenosylmethionine:tRNA ribosyltransferase-isomerase [uncultured Proteiniphilum sp.]|uniref:S-adenosylmethionine:tRNA ribosyltransferase-isomerase n=1 Tax=uncultured Proteiniphilum sp. TaxID=497637 RepID=UPI002604517A|nr:S-adenosylmethionine:tRNA ribosyltransferase-isomerase [uncultured Proteiniphilum sp.]
MKKEKIRQLQISHYNYPLPDGKIAKYPLHQRDASRLLVYDGSQISTSRFGDLPGLLQEGTLLLFNNTRVIHARLLFQKETGAQIEIFCLSPHHPADYTVNFQQRRHCSWHCMVGNARRWKEEPLRIQIPAGNSVVTLKAEKAAITGSDTVVRFSWDNEEFTFSELLEIAGKLPIPPYLNRPAERKDDETYQTVYSRSEGSVAAPTAGLHFTEEVMDRLRDKGIRTAEVTLHVGAGTFRPVKTETIAGHEMHTEFISVPKETIEQLLHHSGKVVVVGTTSMRTVESLYYIGRKLGTDPGISADELGVKQWEPYDDVEEIAPEQALQNILRYLEETGQERLISSTQLMIAPGYEFHFPDAIITNFHQPQSTLLLLISAFVGDDWRKIYDYALQNDYRFLSYGDSSLLWK